MWQMTDWPNAFIGYGSALAFGYLLGSVPFGLILTRLAGTQDIRTLGSGNIGATNVLRTGHKGLAAATLLFDMIKGAAAVLVVGWWWRHDAALLAGLGAFLGHVFPVWLRFKGGKGVATYLGILGAVAWPAALAFVGIWIAVALVTHYSSLSALIASAATPVVLFLMGNGAEAVVFLILTALVWVMHRANIGRLAKGTEGKIGRQRTE